MALDITELYNVSAGEIREAAKAAPTTRICLLYTSDAADD